MLAASSSSSLASCAARRQSAFVPRAAPLAPLAAARRCARSRAVAVDATTKAPAAPVKIVIQGRRLEVTPAIREYVEEKITRAAHNFATQLRRIDVTISARGGDTGTHGARQQKVDVTLHTLRHGVVRVEDAEASLYASIDVAADKVARKLRKVKERAINAGTWAGRAGPRGGDASEADFKEWMDAVVVETRAFDEDQARAAELAHLTAAPGAGAMPASVLRSKVLRVDRMPVDDAVDAMEAVGHAFFLYRDAATGEVQCVYKRAAGGYGVLIPEREAKA